MHYIRSVPVTMKIVLLFIILLELNIVAAIYEGAFMQINLANEDHYRAHCPPKLMSLYRNAKSALNVLCALSCATNSDCYFFSVSGSLCALWTFSLDPSYDIASFGTPTILAYWPKQSGPFSSRDVAIGKPVTSGSVNDMFASAAMLTYGSSCHPNATACYGSTANGNWAVVDLQESLPVTKIVVTAPSKDKNYFFGDITIRAGNTGEQEDTVVGVTPRTATENEAFEYNVTGNIRYIRLQNEEGPKAILVCRVQALL